MAKKRLIRVKVPEETPDQEDDEEKETWSEWGKGTYLRTWYFVGSLTLDLFIVLQTNLSLDWPASLYVSVLAMVIILFIEYRVYVHYWGPEGKWTY